MQPINRARGLTDSERYLASLAERTFLDLWSYPNTFSDRRQNGKGPGKEICDLLVVCGDDVIIFSDKSISWPQSVDQKLAWSRWYRRAVEKSVDQIRGAERWLRLHPSRIFLDSSCSEPLPIALPDIERMRVHGVALALGAQTACSTHFGDRDGSLMVSSDLKGHADHVDSSRINHIPFAFGDVDPSGSFVHVFDETALNLVLREMDTVSDFVTYLRAREGVVRSSSIWAASEADMVAAYLQCEDENGDHFFPTALTQGGTADDHLAIEQGLYSRYLARPERKAKSDADRISYVWDRLIGSFTGHLLAGTSATVGGMEPNVALAERAARAMALENRLARRMLGEAFSGAVTEAVRHGKDRFARVLTQSNGFADPQAGYVFLILAYRGFWINHGYDAYREARAGLLRAYCEVAMFNHRNLKRMVGIALDAPSVMTGTPGGSEDLMLVEIDEWTRNLEDEVSSLAKKAGILNPARLRKRHQHFQEFPDVETATPRIGNRRQRRNAERQRRRSPLRTSH